jgi:hypothetical protein
MVCCNEVAERASRVEIILYLSCSALNVWFGSVVDVRCTTFHADLHAGNLLVMDDGRCVFARCKLAGVDGSLVLIHVTLGAGSASSTLGLWGPSRRHHGRPFRCTVVWTERALRMQLLVAGHLVTRVVFQLAMLRRRWRPQQQSRTLKL